MARRVLVIALLATGSLAFSLVFGGEEPGLPPAADDGAEAADDKKTSLEVRILAAGRTTIGEAPFVSLSCEAANPTDTALMFVGYRPDSFEPPLEEGRISPIFVVELLRGDVWEEYPLGWCGTGMDGIELAVEGLGKFGVAVPDEPSWQAVRVGVRWSRPLDFATAEADAFTVAWSEPFTRDGIDAAAD